MTRWIDRFCRALELAIAALLALMVAMVFGNVVLRYGFNSGITVSEELSRWAFVWMTFLGAVVAVKQGGHLGTDIFIGRLGPTGKKVCLAIAEVAMLYCCWLVFSGSRTQWQINLGVEAPVSGWSLAWLSAAGMVFAVLAAFFHGDKLLRLVRGKLRDDELVTVQESEDLAHLKPDTPAEQGGLR